VIWSPTFKSETAIFWPALAMVTPETSIERVWPPTVRTVS
jgi:hypothetical protein